MEPVFYQVNIDRLVNKRSNLLFLSLTNYSYIFSRSQLFHTVTEFSIKEIYQVIKVSNIFFIISYIECIYN